MTDWTDSVSEASRASPNVPLKQLLGDPAFIAKARRIYQAKKMGGRRRTRRSPKKRSARRSSKRSSGRRAAGRKSPKKSSIKRRRSSRR